MAVDVAQVQSAAVAGDAGAASNAVEKSSVRQQLAWHRVGHREAVQPPPPRQSDSANPPELEQSLVATVAKLSPLNTDPSKIFSVVCRAGRPAGCNFAFFLSDDPACKLADKSQLTVRRVAAMKGVMQGCMVEAAAPPTFSAACRWQIGVQAVCVQEHLH